MADKKITALTALTAVANGRPGGGGRIGDGDQEGHQGSSAGTDHGDRH